MDIPTFYNTATTVSLVLVAGTALVYRRRQDPKRPLGHLAYALFLIVPPLLVVYYSLAALAGVVSAYTWRVPVLVLVFVQLLSGIAGTADFVRVDGADRELVRRRRREITEQYRREKAERRAQRRMKRRPPHNQPHKPEPTRPNAAAQSAARSAQPRTEPDETEPGATAERHS